MVQPCLTALAVTDAGQVVQLVSGASQFSHEWGRVARCQAAQRINAIKTTASGHIFPDEAHFATSLDQT